MTYPIKTLMNVVVQVLTSYNPVTREYGEDIPVPATTMVKNLINQLFVHLCKVGKVKIDNGQVKPINVRGYLENEILFLSWEQMDLTTGTSDGKEYRVRLTMSDYWRSSNE